MKTITILINEVASAINEGHDVREMNAILVNAAIERGLVEEKFVDEAKKFVAENASDLRLAS